MIAGAQAGTRGQDAALVAAGGLPRVFISYSRKDSAAAECLVDDLKKRGFEAYLDKKDIAPGEPWQERLGRLIVDADSVVFLISPDSMESKICSWEVDEAERLAKRVLPVVIRVASQEAVPGRLRRLNWIFLDEGHDRRTELGRLVSALQINLEWVREHTRLGHVALRWQDAGSGADSHELLRGGAVTDAELWISSRPAEAPEITSLHRAFVQASRQAEAARAEAERVQVARTRRFQSRAWWALAAVAVLMLAGVLGLVWQDIETTKREQAVFTQLAEQAIKEDEHNRAMRYALQALPAEGAMPWTPSSRKLEGILGGAATAGRLVQRHKLDKADFKVVTFSPNGQFVHLTSAADKTVKLLNMADWTELSSFSSRRSAREPVLSPSGGFIARESHSGEFQLYNTLSGAKISVQDPEYFNGSIFFSQDGKRIVAFGNRGTIWDTSDGRRRSVINMRLRNVNSAVFSPASNYLLASHFDGKLVRIVSLWNADTGEEKLRLTLGRQWLPNGHSEILAFSSDGRVMAVAIGAAVQLVEVETGKTMATLRGHSDTVLSIAFSPDGSQMVTGSADRTARIWDIKEGRELAMLVGHSFWVSSAAFSPGGDYVVTNTGRESPLWERTEDRVLGMRWVRVADFGPQNSVTSSASFHPTEPLYVAWQRSGSLSIWKTALGATVNSSFDEDSGLFTNPIDNVSKNWNRDSGNRIGASRITKSLTGSLSPDGKRSASIADSLDVVIIDAESNNYISRLKGGNRYVRWHSTGKQLVTYGDAGPTKIWDVSWLSNVGGDLRERVCTEKLIGAQEFDSELSEPVLQGIEREGPIGRNPCRRRGPVSWVYWSRLPEHFIGTIRSALQKSH